MNFRNFIWLFLLLFCLKSTEGFSFTLSVPPRRRECFYETVTQGVGYEVEYQVIDGGELDINFIIETPTGQLVVPDIRKTSDLHKLTASETGDYSFCFDNSFSQFSSKVVFFELYVAGNDSDDEGDAVFANLPDDADYEIKLEDFKDAVDKIHSNLQRSSQTQKLFAALESRDRSIVETNFERVNFWSTLQMIAMIAAAAVNVVIVRYLFDDRRSVSGTKLRT